jgi:hypothetical protein
VAEILWAGAKHPSGSIQIGPECTGETKIEDEDDLVVGPRLPPAFSVVNRDSSEGSKLVNCRCELRDLACPTTRTHPQKSAMVR